MAIDFIPGGYLIDAGGSNNMSATMNSMAVRIDGCKTLGFHITVDNTDAIGDIRIQVSNDPDETETSWVNVELSSGATSVPVASSDVSAFVDVETGAKWTRVRWERTSGNGELYVSLNKKLGQ